MAYRLADSALTHDIETRRQRDDDDAADFYFLLRRPSPRRSPAVASGRRLEVVMAMVALSAPVWCPIATYLCAGVGGDGTSQLGAALAGVLGFVVGVAVAITAIVHGVLKSR